MSKYLKFHDWQVVMSEIPGEVSLAFNITNCQNRCEGCHSPWLREDNGVEFTFLRGEIDGYPYIECVSPDVTKNIKYCTNILLLGEGNDYSKLVETIHELRSMFPKKKISLYSGRTEVEDDLYKILDYIKVGPYIHAYGPLNKETTNQRLYRTNGDISKREDITNLFWTRI